MLLCGRRGEYDCLPLSIFDVQLTLVVHGWAAIVDGDRGGCGCSSVGDIVQGLFTHTPTTATDDTNDTYYKYDHAAHCDRYGRSHTQ